MSALDVLRSFAESREAGAVLIRDGISYGDIREVLAELEADKELLRAKLAEAERERNENAVALVRATKLADERYQYTCTVLAERNDAMIRAELAEADSDRLRSRAPIAKVGVLDGQVVVATLYAPGLPDGDHELYCGAGADGDVE